MKLHYIKSASVALAGISLLLGAAAFPASAETEGSFGLKATVGARANATGTHAEANASTSARMEAKTEDRQQKRDEKNKKNLEHFITKGDKEISQRIDSLNKLAAKTAAMKYVSSSTKATIASELQAQIQSLTTLKASIDAGTSASSTRDLDKSITAAYRIYALIIPQTEIIAAADKAMTTADTIASSSVKLQVKIETAHTAGKYVASLQVLLADIALKVADAKAQAGIAVNAVVSLTPDNGDTAKASANHATLVGARANIKAATSDLETARKDAKSITKGLKAFHLNASSTSSVETNH